MSGWMVQQLRRLEHLFNVLQAPAKYRVSNSRMIGASDRGWYAPLNNWQFGTSRSHSAQSLYFPADLFPLSRLIQQLMYVVALNVI